MKIVMASFFLVMLLIVTACKGVKEPNASSTPDFVTDIQERIVFSSQPYISANYIVDQNEIMYKEKIIKQKYDKNKERQNEEMAGIALDGVILLDDGTPEMQAISSSSEDRNIVILKATNEVISEEVVGERSLTYLETSETALRFLYKEQYINGEAKQKIISCKTCIGKYGQIIHLEDIIIRYVSSNDGKLTYSLLSSPTIQGEREYKISAHINHRAAMPNWKTFTLIKAPPRKKMDPNSERVNYVRNTMKEGLETLGMSYTKKGGDGVIVYDMTLLKAEAYDPMDEEALPDPMIYSFKLTFVERKTGPLAKKTKVIWSAQVATKVYNWDPLVVLEDLLPMIFERLEVQKSMKFKATFNPCTNELIPLDSRQNDSVFSRKRLPCTDEKKNPSKFTAADFP